MSTPRGLSRLPNPDTVHYRDELAPGWYYIRRRRDWSLRGFPRGAVGANSHDAPLTWWEARRHGREEFSDRLLSVVVAQVRAGVSE